MTIVVDKLAELEGQIPTYEDYKQFEELTPFFSNFSTLDTVTRLQLEDAIKDAILFHIIHNKQIQTSEIEQIYSILHQNKSIASLELPKPTKEEIEKFDVHNLAPARSS